MSKIILGTLLCIALVDSIFANSSCEDVICIKANFPVCGTDGNTFQTFDNDCKFQYSNCILKNENKKEYTATDMAWCSSRQIENWGAMFDKLDINKPECMKACPMVYAPVCVTNEEYRASVAHTCQMELLNCALGKDTLYQFRKLKDGPC